MTTGLVAVGSIDEAVIATLASTFKRCFFSVSDSEPLLLDVVFSDVGEGAGVSIELGKRIFILSVSLGNSA